MEFLCVFVLFIGPIGFCLSFLDAVCNMAIEVALDDVNLAVVFGVANAFGRFSASIPADYIGAHLHVNVLTYIVLSAALLVAGLLCLVLPPAPGIAAVQAANAIVALGYGGIMACVPFALPAFFNVECLGLMYGVLCFWAYLSVCFWDMFAVKPQNCHGVACYRPYCLGGALSAVVVVLLGVFIGARRIRPDGDGLRPTPFFNI